MCLLTFILHEVKEAGGVIAEAFRLLKSDDRLVIVEQKADLDSPGAPWETRISKRQIEQLLIQAGLSLESHIDWSQNYDVATQKQEAATTGLKPVTKVNGNVDASLGVKSDVFSGKSQLRLHGMDAMCPNLLPLESAFSRAWMK